VTRLAQFPDRLARPASAVLLFLSVVLASLALGIGLFAERAPARSRPDGIRLLQLNICGNVCNHDRPVTGVVATVAGFRPEAVSLNEVCRGQLAALGTGLARSGWAMQARFLVTAPGACAGEDYGIAVLTRSGVVGADTVSYARQGPGARERRGLLCARTALAGRPTQVCSTHLVSRQEDPTGDVRRAQVAQAAAVVGAAPLPVVLLGDLNLPPDDPRMAALYGVAGGTGAGPLVEVDEAGGRCRCGPATHSSGSKLDYVFVSGRSFAVRGAGVAATSFSDHKALRAVVAAR
jgi:endonuclease/exonuclease/phosphatase family metal-dependent hydrolase